MSIFDYKDNFKEIENIPCHLVWESPDAPKIPEVSIVMPVYTNHYYFHLALQSALNQDWKGSYEIVVVDNDTSENNPNQQIIEEFNDPRVRYYRNSENIGMTGNWNRGIMMSRAPYITFLHDDDMFMPNTLLRVMSVSVQNPGKLVLSGLLPIDMNGNTWVSDTEYELNRKLWVFKPREVARMSVARALCSNLGNLVGSLFERENLINLGGFCAESYPPLDYEMAVRYCHKYGAVKIRKPVACYRFADNTSYKVYATMAPKLREIAEDMIEVISLPRWIMHKIADTHCKYVDTYYRSRFAPPEEHINHKVSLLDRRLTLLYINLLNLFEGYTLTIFK